MKSKKGLVSLVLSTGAIALSSISTPVLADDDIYIKVGLGVASTSDMEVDVNESPDYTLETDGSNFNVNIGLGREFGKWRVEGEYNQNISKIDKAKQQGQTANFSPDLEVDIKSYQLSLLRDFNKGERFSPYVGVGAGITEFSNKSQTITTKIGEETSTDRFEKSDDSAFHYALIGGISYNMNEKSSLFTEVKYVKTSEIELGDEDKVDGISQTMLIGGLKFKF